MTPKQITTIIDARLTDPEAACLKQADSGCTSVWDLPGTALRSLSLRELAENVDAQDLVARLIGRRVSAAAAAVEPVRVATFNSCI